LPAVVGIELFVHRCHSLLLCQNFQDQITWSLRPRFWERQRRSDLRSALNVRRLGG
jgi:hypothetical protein